MNAELPKNENERLAELESLEILDTLEEEDYDNLVFLASQVTQCPISLVSLIDKHRQWFKAKVGLDVRETDRDFAFCSHAILEPHNPMIIPDASEDIRFKDNPLVTSDPKIKFYAGIPLVTNKNCAIGTLCVIDRVPRILSSDQLKALQIITQQVVVHLNLRRAHKKLSKLNSSLSSLNDFRNSIFETSSEELERPVQEIKSTIQNLSGVSNDRNNADSLERLNHILELCDTLSTNINQFKSTKEIYTP